MKVAILGQKLNWHIRGLEEAFKKRGTPCDFVKITDLVANVFKKPKTESGNFILDDYKVIVVRSLPYGSLEQIIFRMDVLHRLEKMGVKVVNSANSLEICADKFYSSFLFEEEGIPTPRTIITERFEMAMEAFLSFKDVVVKPLFGSEGKGMVRIQHEEIAYRVFRALEREKLVFYIQEFIPHYNRDFRIFTIKGDPVGGIVRCSKDWKTTLAEGAVATPLEISPNLKNISKQASLAVNAFYAGVDIIESEDGRLLVTEINGIPGWKGLQTTTGIDISSKLAEKILESFSG